MTEQTKEEKPRHRGSFLPGYDPRRATGGAPKRTCDGTSIPEYARSFGVEMLEVLVGIARDPKAKAADRSKAAERVLSRGFGSAPQTIQISGQVEHEHVHQSLDLTGLSLDLKRELLERMLAQEAVEGEIVALPNSVDHDPRDA